MVKLTGFLGAPSKTATIAFFPAYHPVIIIMLFNSVLGLVLASVVPQTVFAGIEAHVFAVSDTASSTTLSNGTSTGNSSSTNSSDSSTLTTSTNATVPTDSTSSPSTATSAASADSSSATSSNSTTSASNSTSSNSSTSGDDNAFNSTSPYNTSSTSSISYTSLPFPYPLNSSFPQNSQHPVSRWTTAHSQARAYLTNWTLEEKVNLTTGTGWQIGRCVGNIPAIPARNFSGLCLEDSPLGVRFADFVSAFPAAINVATTFDKDLMYARGYAMGQEFRGKGVHVALGPMTNMARVAAGGRNWEGFGADPYLSGWGTEMTVRGLQDAGVQACVKHFVGNEQEHSRTTSTSNIDDRTMREIYTHPFLRAVAVDVASVMCSYNLINGTWACQNPEALNGILKTDLGFQGYVMSDWTATQSGVLSVNNGLDMTMPGDVVFGSLTSFFGSNLTTAVNNGSVAVERVDDMAERIMAAYFLLGQDREYPEINFDAFRRLSEVNNSRVDVQDDHYKVIQHIGAASTVLLKNENHTLPLGKPRTIALIGSDLGPSLSGPNGYPDRGGDDGTLAMGWGSGTADFPYLIDLLQAISLPARHDHTSLSWWFNDFDLEGAALTATGVEVAMVGINSDSGEQYITVEGNQGDRNNLTAWHGGEALVKAVAAVNNNTVVVIHSVGPMILEAWIDHPNVTAVLWAGLPGQESGNSLVDVLYGSYNPSGRLPYTISRNRTDFPAEVVYEDELVPGALQINYTEGLNIDYRHFMSRNIRPRYEFGYGLSYTSFNFTNLQVYDIVYRHKRSNGEVVENVSRPVGAFLEHSLQMPRWTVTADIQNVGSVDGCEVPQLYLSYPEAAGEPPRVLRDFTRINLQPWQAQKVYFNLSNYDVSIWDVEQQTWTIPAGEFGVVVAKSSMEDGLTGSFCPSGTY